MIDSKELTMEEIQTIGLAILQKELGTRGMVRFLQIYSNGRGDYTKERERILANISFDDFVEGIKQDREISTRHEQE